jgi:apolipoprotein N-acyltransferase
MPRQNAFWFMELWAAAGFPPPCSSCRFRSRARSLPGAVFSPGSGSFRFCGQFWLAYSTKRPPSAASLSFLLSYLCGILWYTGNCYWVRDVMSQYGDMPPMAPTLLLLGFSMVLGLYFGLFGLSVMLVRRATGSTRWALAAAPILWAALELPASRITSVPWDQLGYSQVDNMTVNQLAPWTGVYGISFLLVAANALSHGSRVLMPCLPVKPGQRGLALPGAFGCWLF